MAWTKVAIPKVLKRTDTHVTVLLVLPGHLGQFSVVAVPYSAMKQLEGSVWQMQQHVLNHIAKTARRYQGELWTHNSHQPSYIFGPINGKYYDVMGVEQQL